MAKSLRTQLPLSSTQLLAHDNVSKAELVGVPAEREDGGGDIHLEAGFGCYVFTADYNPDKTSTGGMEEKLEQQHVSLVEPKPRLGDSVVLGSSHRDDNPHRKEFEKRLLALDERLRRASARRSSSVG